MSIDLATAVAEELVEPARRESLSVGLVKTQFATLFEPPNELPLINAKLGPVRVAYETYGELSAARDNAIFVCHALTGDAHVAGLRSETDKKPGWWDELVGPGKGLDTNRYFIICANVLGGCQGTTGPGSIYPATGTPYGLRFPFLTVGDFVQVHSALVKHLGIEKLLAIVGGSLGGMQVLEWAARYPDQIRGAVCLASAARLTAQGIAFNCVGRHAIVTDPNFHKGDYYDKPAGPNHGLALARMVAHITYLSEASIEKKFGRRLQHAERFAYELLHDTEFQVESYLHHQGSRFVERFDANSYLYLTRAMEYFDLAEGYGSLEKALSQTQARFLITSYTTDWLFPTVQSQELVDALVAARRHVSFVELTSPYGHDSFLLEVEPLEELLTPFLEQAYLEGEANGMKKNGDRHDRVYCMSDPLERLTDEAIVAHIAFGSRVLDLGCGEGRLLKRLRDAHGASVQGLEIDRRRIIGAIANGVPVVYADLDRGLAGFPDRAFDFAVLSQTLQQVRHPRLILHEMLRVAGQSLVVVPNYGYWRVRLDHLVRGRAPVTSALPYEWYDTPNLHFMSMHDFRELVTVVGGRIVRELPMIGGRTVDRAWAANLRAEAALYVLEKESR